MSEFGSPSQVLRLLVGSHESAGGGPLPEIMRRQEAWEKQIDMLDEKEKELQNNQLQLIREQSATFVRDLSYLRQEVVRLKGHHDEYLETGASMQAECSQLKDVIERERKEFAATLQREASKFAASQAQLEERCRQLGDALNVHSELHKSVESKMQEHKAAFERQMEFGHNSLKDMLEQQEDTLTRLHRMSQQDKTSSDKHHSDSHDRLNKLEKEAQALKETLGSTKQDLEEAVGSHHETVEERFQHLQKALRESCKNLESSMDHTVFKHNEEMDKLRDEVERNSKHRAQMEEMLKGKDANMQERVRYLEELLGDDSMQHRHLGQAGRSMVELSADMKARVDLLERSLADSADAHRRKLEEVARGHEGSVAELRRAHDEQTASLRDLARAHAEHGERITHLDVLGARVDKHEQHIQDALSRHDKNREELEATAQRIEQHHRGLDDLRRLHEDHKARRASLVGHHSTLQERVEYLENLLSESLDELRGATGEHSDFHKSHASALSAAHAKIDELHSRISDCEKHGRPIDDLRRAQSSDGKVLGGAVAGLQERLDALEGKHRSLADSHAREIDSLKDTAEKHVTAMSKHSKDLDAIKESHLQQRESARQSTHVLRTETASRAATQEDALQRHHEGLQSRVERLEAFLYDHSEKHSQVKAACEKHAALHAQHAADLEALKETQANHVASAAKIPVFERSLRELTDKHEAHRSGTQGTLEHVHMQLLSVEKHSVAISDLQKKHSALVSQHGPGGPHHAELQGRLDHLESTLNASVDRSSKELLAVKTSHQQHLSRLQAESEESRVDQRLEQLEEAARKHAREMTAVNSRIERATSRATDLEVELAAIGELKKALASMSRDRAALEARHQALEEGVAHLKHSFNDLPDKNALALQAVDVKMEHMSDRLVGCEKHGPAVAELRKVVTGFSADKAARDLHFTSLEERVGHIEKGLLEVGHKHDAGLEAIKAAHDKQSITLAKCTREVDAIKVNSQQQFYSLGERVDAVEAAHGEHHDRHASEVAAAHKKIDALQGRLADDRAARERHSGSVNELVTQHRDRLDEHAASVTQRVGQLESSIAEHAHRSAKEISAAKAATAAFQGDAQARDAQLLSLLERVEHLEASFREASASQRQSVQAAHASLERVQGRLSVVKDAWCSGSGPYRPGI